MNKLCTLRHRPEMTMILPKAPAFHPPPRHGFAIQPAGGGRITSTWSRYALCRGIR